MSFVPQYYCELAHRNNLKSRWSKLSLSNASTTMISMPVQSLKSRQAGRSAEASAADEAQAHSPAAMLSHLLDAHWRFAETGRVGRRHGRRS
jgi:hypothetical protein